MDNLTIEQRRKNMQSIRSTNTTPERIIFRELRRRNIYFAKHVDSIVGRPDIVFRRRKIAVFIDSDFWHGHPSRGVLPKSNTEYWHSKILRNKKRDKSVTSELHRAGWTVVRIWEHDVRKRTGVCIRRIMRALSRGA